MNKKIVIGIAFLVIATLLYFYYENDISDFLNGFCFAAGIVLIFSGLVKSKSKND